MAKKFNFTKESLQSLPTPDAGQRAVYLDAKATGLQIRVTPTGAKTFSVYRRIKGGRPERVTLGCFPTMSIEQARKFAARVNAEIEEGSSPAKVKRAHRAEPTFAEVLKLFIPAKKKRNGQPLSERTKRDYQDSVRLHLSKLQSLKLSQIGRDDVRRTHAAITKISPASANRAVALISSVYNYAIDELAIYAGTNPAAKIKKNYEAPRERFAQADEMPRLFAAMADYPMGDFFLLSLLTGARRANFQAMRKSEINLDDGVWQIPMTDVYKRQVS